MASRTRTLFATAATLTVAAGLQAGAPAVDRGDTHRGRWPAFAEARLMAATREGGQQAQAKPQPPPPPPPQTPPADPTQPPVFRTGINFVRVDVIISDKAGNPVADLTAADFDVNEDGKPQKIETFKLVKL